MPLRLWLTAVLAGLIGLACPPAGAAELPIFDAHVHYSHDAWDNVPPAVALKLVREAGVKRVLVSSSNDEGQQRLVQLAPEVFLPALRPYRQRGDQNGWWRDPGIVAYLEERLAKYRYVAIGEFHIFGADVDLPVPRHLIGRARERNLVLHSHSDADAIEREFVQWPAARILWAHAGFDSAARVRAMLARHPRLWCDLAFRTDFAPDARLELEWKQLFIDFPERFMVGSDTFTPERWPYVVEHARWARAWLAQLPAAVAERVAFRNGEQLFVEGPR
ncbi:MAG: amidohydrolase [Betaproteobacteria bacterium]